MSGDDRARTQRERRAAEVFKAALDYSDAAERAAFLEHACGGDAELRAAVEALIQDDAASGGFLAEARSAHRHEAPQAGTEAATGQENPADLKAGRPEKERTGAATADLTTFEPEPPSERPGTIIGRYKLLEQIGEGGFGSVWMAEQREPVRRRVALKVIKLGMDTRQVIARFEAERQALALMDHPNIAKVLDGGATEQGRPFFVMELVRGVPITEFCDHERLDTKRRLELFAQVCNAVQHAHTKGVIHRDIKPSNVLVTLHDGVPVPKVIDFGIAKATNAELTEKTLFTEHRQMIGTPAYMSPEQAEMSGLDIDTRSDVYSLGVLLYELLTGTPPFDPQKLRSAGYAEMVRIIREEEPPKPSTRVASDLRVGRLPSELQAPARGPSEPGAPATGQPLPHGRGSVDDVARRRGTDPRALSRVLRGELDWIVMKCLEKDRARRYETASALAADVRRHLVGDPLEAKRDSTLYVLHKMLRRYRVQAAVGAGFVSLIAVSALWMSALYARADARATEAQHERRSAERISQFMEETLSGVRAAVALGRDTALLREMLDAAAKRIDDGELADAPVAELRLRSRLGDTYRQIGAYDRARQMLEPAADKARSIYGPEHAEVARALYLKSSLLKDIDEPHAALQMAEAALALRQRLHGGDHPEVMHALGAVAQCQSALGRTEEALELYKSALDMSRRLTPGDSPDTSNGLKNVAACLTKIGVHTEEALRMQTEALEMQQRLHPNDHPDVALSLLSTAAALHTAGRVPEALTKYEDALAMYQRLHAGDHPHIAKAKNDLANGLQSLGRFAEALPRFEESLAMGRRLYATGHREIAFGLHNVAYCLVRLGRPAEALPLYDEAIGMYRRISPEDYRTIAVMNTNRAECLAWMGHWSDALTAHEEVLALRQTHFPGEGHAIAQSLNNLGQCLLQLGRAEDALPRFEAALGSYAKLHPGDHPTVADTSCFLADCLLRVGRPEEGWSRAETAIAMYGRLYKQDHPSLATSLNVGGQCLAAMARFEEGRERLEAALAMRRRLYPGDHPDIAQSLTSLGECLQSMGCVEEALIRFEAASEMRRRLYPDGHLWLALSLQKVGVCLLVLDRPGEARAMLEEALAMNREFLPAEHATVSACAIEFAHVLVTLRDYRHAEGLLLDVASRPQATSSRKVSGLLMKGLAELYESWNAAEPRKGYDAEAVEWRARLQEWHAATQPAAQSQESGL